MELKSPKLFACAALIAGCVAHYEYPLLEGDPPAEDGGPAEDAGTEEDTTEPPPDDSGVTVPMDTGVAARPDTGTAARDTGTAARDTGTPARDTGTAPADTGTAPRDTGTATTDTGPGPGPTTCGTLPTFADGFRPLRERFVAPGGRDGADGSSGAPWATIAYALENARPGDRITVRRGTYRGGCGQFVYRGGTLESPVWLAGESETGVILDCSGGTSGDAALRLSRAHHIVVENLEIRNTSGHGVHIDNGASHILFRRVHIHHADLALVKANQSDHLYFERCDLHDSGDNAWVSQGIDFVGVQAGHVAFSNIHDIPENVGLQAKGGSADILYANNALWNVGEVINLGGSTEAQYFQPRSATWEGRNIVARNNLISARHRAITAQGCHDCQIVANTIWGGGDQQGIRAVNGNTGGGGTSVTRNLLIANNIVAWPATAYSVPCLMDIGRDGLRVMNNLWWAAGRRVSEAYGLANCRVTEAGSLVDVNPQLTAPDGGATANYRPRAASPVVGRGATSVGVRDDFTGACRPSALDIGAFQH